MVRAGVPPQRQKGSAAIEFALIFPVFFLIVYGLITYGLIMVAQQTLTSAVSDGARAALRYNSTGNPATVACNAVNVSAAWIANVMGGTLMNCSTSPPTLMNCSYNTAVQCLKVTATYPYSTYPLVPTLPLISLAIPTTLSATAIIQLEPSGPTTP
jgi:Flp pilus assembly protein TadG